MHTAIATSSETSKQEGARVRESELWVEPVEPQTDKESTGCRQLGKKLKMPLLRIVTP